MASEVHYLEAPRPPGEYGRTAEDIVRLVAEDLRVPPPRVRWLERVSAREASDAQARGRFTTTRAHPIAGLYSPEDEGAVFLVAGAAVFKTIAHETRHYARRRRTNNTTFWNTERVEHELDAAAYTRHLQRRLAARRGAA